MFDFYVGRYSSASAFPLNAFDFECCASAYEYGRRNDIAFFTGDWAPEEHLIRATEVCEFRGLMVRQGILGAPRTLGKYPRAVMFARQRGRRIERVFAPLAPEFLTSANTLATLAAIDARPAEWFADCRRKIGSAALVLADTIETGALQ